MKLTPIVVVAVSVLFASPLHAQWRAGGVVGINLASISVDPERSSESYSGRTAFGIGAVLDRGLSGQIDLRLEPMFLQKGATVEEGGIEATFALNYLELPVLLRYTFPREGPAQPFVMAGPNLGFLLSAKYDFTDGGEQDAKDETKSVDLGFGVGGGVMIPREQMTLFCEARYVLGFTDLNSESDESTVKNRGLQILVGATVPVGR